MIVFQLLSFLTAFILLAIIIIFIKKERFLLVKPSIWFLIFFHLIVQWASVFYSETVYTNLEEPYSFYILCHIIPFGIFFFSRLTLRRKSKILYDRLVRTNLHQNQYRKTYTYFCFILLPIMLFSILVYLAYVPLSSTGLYHLATDSSPYEAALARENSAKLLPYTWLKYLYTFNSKFVVPYFACFLSLVISFLYREKKYFKILFCLSLLGIFTLGAMLPGARLTAVYIFFTFISCFIFKSINNLRIFKFFILCVLITLPAVFIHMSVYNDLSFENFFISLEEIILRRIFYVPMIVGVKWIAYVEQFGFWGATGIMKIASLLGEKPVNIANVMMNYYFSYKIDSGFMTASFVFTYYCYFGPLSFIIILLCILFLDLWLYLFNRIDHSILLPSVVAINSATTHLISSEYLTIFISYGFLSGIIFIFLLQALFVKKNDLLTKNFKENTY